MERARHDSIRVTIMLYHLILTMKKFFKYLGIIFAVLVLIILAGYGLGKMGIADDELLLRKFQENSKQFYAEKQSFSGFCSSELYVQLKSKYAYDLSCTGGQAADGSDLQIIAESPAGSSLGCRVATFPPVNGEQQKAIACVQIPRQVGSSLQ